MYFEKRRVAALKIKQISCDKVSVYLTNEDLELFDISPETLGPQSNDLHQFLFMLMETVKFETEFDPYNGQVIVEAKMTVDGLYLLISKVCGDGVHKITRDEFRRARSVRAVKSLKPLEISGKNMTGSMKSKRGSKTSVFVFDGFRELESAILLVDDGTIEKCELYRDGKRYALISEISKNSRPHGILNEFAALYKMSDVLADDIREGWKSVAQHDDLAEMVRELRDMR